MTSRCLLFFLVLCASFGRALAAPGDLDSTFNGTGIVVTPVADGSAKGHAVALQADGKLVVAGEASNGGVVEFAVVRYDTFGTPDPSFGGTGILTTPVGGIEDRADAVIQQSDGKIVTAGLSFGAGFNDSALALVRYLDNGMLDPDFGGGDGKVTTPVSGGYDEALALIQQADGKLVVAGYAGTDIVVVRYGLDGTPDMGFNGTGTVTTTVGASATAFALVQQADGKLVVAGSTDDGAGNVDMVLVRYETDGDPDPMFGGGTGIVVTPVGSGTSEAHALVQEAGDGKLVAAGFASNGTDDDFALVRHGTDGAVDSSFGTMGVTLTPIGSGQDQAFGLVQQADGQFVAGGFASNGTDLDFALVRYDTGGTPDAGFGTAGVVITSIGTGDDAIEDLLVQPNGGLVAAGRSKSGSTLSFAVARYLTLTGPTSSTTTTTTTSTVPGSSTTSTTGSVPTTTTSSTLLATLVPGGPAPKTSSDCYLELRVTGVTAAQVQRNQVVPCTDGDPCDQGPCGDDRCDFQIAACTSQTDPALADCTPPPSLTSAKLGAKAGLTPITDGPACTAPTTLAVSVKRNGRGKVLAARSKAVIKGSATAPKGTSPRKDRDKWTFQCAPRSSACPTQ